MPVGSDYLSGSGLLVALLIAGAFLKRGTEGGVLFVMVVVPLVAAGMGLPSVVWSLGSLWNPHGADLWKQRAVDSCGALSNGISAGQAMIMECPRPELQLTYMNPVSLTTEFTLGPGVT